MATFPKKHFQGVTYDFGHLEPTYKIIPLNAGGTVQVGLHVSFSIHCFTEGFDSAVHAEHHIYSHMGEIRAFDITRHSCSLQLPYVIESMMRGTIYRAKNNNFTYVAQLEFGPQKQPYSIFFDLKKDSNSKGALPNLRMYVQSAYLMPLTVSSSATNWRFGSLAGQIAGLFSKPSKKPKPKKKKAP